MASWTLRSGFYGPVGLPTPTRGSRHQPNPCLVCVLCLLGTTSSWPKEGPCNLTDRSFQVFMEPKKCQCLCLVYILLAGDHLRDPSPKARGCRSHDKPLHHWDIPWQRKALFKLEPLRSQCKIKISLQPNVNEMAQALGRLCTFFSSRIKQRHVRTRELKG